MENKNLTDIEEDRNFDYSLSVLRQEIYDAPIEQIYETINEMILTCQENNIDKKENSLDLSQIQLNNANDFYNKLDFEEALIWFRKVQRKNSNIMGDLSKISICEDKVFQEKNIYTDFSNKDLIKNTYETLYKDFENLNDFFQTDVNSKKIEEGCFPEIIMNMYFLFCACYFDIVISYLYLIRYVCEYRLNKFEKTSKINEYVINELLKPNNPKLFQEIKKDMFILNFLNEFDEAGLMGFDYADLIPIFKKYKFVDKFSTDNLDKLNFENYKEFKSYIVIINVNDEYMFDFINEAENYFEDKDYLLQAFNKKSFPNNERFRILLFK